MKAVRIHQYGGPEVLTLEDVPRPEAGAGEVLVAIRASGVNPADWKIRAGLFKDFMPLRFPVILGFDFAGEVEGVGAGVTGFKRGDAVYGTAMGTYAEYVAAKVAEVGLKPRTVDFVKAATIPVAAQTAWQALFDVGGLEAGKKALIHGAAGGVGSIAVQLAKAKGATVAATASGRNQEYLKQLGVDQPIDYEKTRFEDVVKDADVVFDTQGGETQQRSWKTLKKGGVLVSIVEPPSEAEAARVGAKGVFLGRQPNADQLVEIAKLVDAGRIQIAVEAVLPLADARKAQELSQTGHVRGKIVLTTKTD